jgi:hypothetical protein
MQKEILLRGDTFYDAPRLVPVPSASRACTIGTGAAGSESPSLLADEFILYAIRGSLAICTCSWRYSKKYILPQRLTPLRARAGIPGRTPRPDTARARWA